MGRNAVAIMLLALSAVSLSVPASAQRSALRTRGAATQLEVGGRPFLILGGEMGNSSASSPDDFGRIFPRLREVGLNTVLVPVYWDLTEPVEGRFDFSLTDAAISRAREDSLKLVFLWFGAWKNSMSCYAPLWFKEDWKRFPRAHTEEGKPMEIASAFSGNVYGADSCAFLSWLGHIAEVDGGEGTVVMVQVENEIGMLEDARDHSPEADKAFGEAVPERLLSYLRANWDSLHPRMREALGNKAFKGGSWGEVFGGDARADEIFMAWHYASYVGRLAEAAKALYPIPLYVNAAMDSRGRKPGEYPSAGPLAHLIDVWRCAAPSIDLLAPDLYDDGFKDWVRKYALPGNPLFIPEVRLSDDDGVRAMYVFGEHEAIGFSPFSIEDYCGGADSPLSKGYRTLAELAPLLHEWRGKGASHGLLFDQEDKERVISDGDLTLTCRHAFTLPWDPRATDGSVWPEGGGLVLRLGEREYLVAGSGIVIEFAGREEGGSASAALGEDGFALAEGVGGAGVSEQGSTSSTRRCGIGSVDEVRVGEDGSLRFVRRLGGDQTHQGRHVRISVGDWKILHVKLYDYE